MSYTDSVAVLCRTRASTARVRSSSSNWLMTRSCFASNRLSSSSNNPVVALLYKGTSGGVLLSRAGVVGGDPISDPVRAPVGVLIPTLVGALIPALLRVLIPALLRVLIPALLRVLIPALLRVLIPALLRVLIPALLRTLVPALMGALVPALLRALIPALLGALIPAQGMAQTTAKSRLRLSRRPTTNSTPTPLRPPTTTNRRLDIPAQPI